LNDFPVEPLDNLLEQALKRNLDLQAAQKNIEIANALVNSAAWLALPQVDLVGSLTSNSLGGTSQNVIFGGDTLRSTNSGSLGTVLSQVFKRKFPGWSVGIEFTLPIGLRKGLGEKDRLEAGSLIVQQNYIELSRSLEKQIRNSYRELVHGNERLKVSRDGVDAAQEQVRIGTIEFQNGRLTAFELVRLSEDLALAQQRYSEALVKTAKAAADLKQLTSGYYPSGNNE
jgi:outer membrane protein TolC